MYTVWYFWNSEGCFVFSPMHQKTVWTWKSWTGDLLWCSNPLVEDKAVDYHNSELYLNPDNGNDSEEDAVDNDDDVNEDNNSDFDT